jgi:hypothetical protein
VQGRRVLEGMGWGMAGRGERRLDLGYSFFKLAPCKKSFCTSRAFAVQYRKAGVGVLTPHEGPTMKSHEEAR